MASDLKGTEQTIYKWLEYPSNYKEWINKKTKGQEGLTALNQSVQVALNQAGAWNLTQYYSQKNLIAFITSVIDAANENLAALHNQAYQHAVVASCVTAIITNSFKILQKSQALYDLNFVGCNIFPFLQHSAQLLISRDSSMSLSVFQLDALLSFVTYLSLDSTSLLQITAQIGLLAENKLVSFASPVDTGWLEDCIREYKLDSQTAAECLRFFAALMQSYNLKNELSDEVLYKLARSLQKKPAVDSIFSGLKNLKSLLIPRFNLDMQKLLMDLEASFKFLIENESEKEVKHHDSTPSTSHSLVEKVQLIQEIFDVINNKSKLPCPLSYATLQQLMQVGLKQADKLSSGDLNELLVSIGKMIQQGETKESEKEQLQLILKQYIDILSEYAEMMDLGTVSRSLYAISLFEYFNPEVTKKLTDKLLEYIHAKPALTADRSTLILIHQASHYYNNSGKILPEFFKPYMTAVKPKVKEHSIQDDLRLYLPKQDWFSGKFYSPEESSFHSSPPDICISKEKTMTTGNLVVDLDGYKSHTPGILDERQNRLKWENKLRDRQYLKMRDEKGRPVVSRIWRIPMYPPNRPDFDTVVTKIRGYVLEMDKDISSTPELPSSSLSSLTISYDAKTLKIESDVKHFPPTIREPQIETTEKSSRKKAKKKKKSKKQKQLLPVKLGDVLQAIKDQDENQLKTLMSAEKLALNASEKTHLMIAILQMTAARSKKIALLKIVCELLSGEIISNTNAKGLSPIVCAVQSNFPEAVRILVEKRKIPSPTPQEWQKAAQIAVDAKYQEITNILKQHGVVVATASPKPPVSTPYVPPKADTAVLEDKKEPKDKKMNSSTFHSMLSSFAPAIHSSCKTSELSEEITLFLALQGDFYSQYCLAGKYKKEGDDSTYLYWLKKSADSGYALAQYELGYEYCQQKEKELQKEGVRYYTLTAEQGNPISQFNLAVCYTKGIGVEVNLKEAVKWYRLAAEQNFPSAQFRLGIYYQMGNGVNRDVKEAIRLFRLAADQGEPYAQINLGLCYVKGEGVNRDVKEAIRLFRLAADQGNPQAQTKLGLCYHMGKGVNRDVKEAIRWFRLAAAQNNPTAQYKLGNCYYSGAGVTVDKKEAVNWYQLAVAQNYREAQYKLGVCYESGAGVATNMKEAVKLYELAAKQGHGQAQYNLGVSYDLCIGKNRNESEAIYWYKQAADKGVEDAKKRLQSVPSSLIIEIMQKNKSPILSGSSDKKNSNSKGSKSPDYDPGKPMRLE